MLNCQIINFSFFIPKIYLELLFFSSESWFLFTLSFETSQEYLLAVFLFWGGEVAYDKTTFIGYEK